MARCRAFSFLLQPTAKQATGLTELLAAQRELFNAALEERRGAWRWERRSVSRYDQYRQLTGMAAERPDVMRFGVCVARGSSRSQAVFRCLACGYRGNADINAAVNILRAGQAQRKANAEREAAWSQHAASPD